MKTQIILIRGGETYDSYEDYIVGLKGMTVSFDRLTTKGWKEKLPEAFGDDVQVIVPGMPNALNAKYFEWKIYFEKLIPFLNDRLIFVGSSLGSIFLIKYLSENTFPKKILGLFLVGAPYDAEGTDYTLADFVLGKNLDMVARHCDNIHFYFSSDDPVIPLTNMEKYKKALPKAQYALLDNRGHFNVIEFSELETDIRDILSRFDRV